MIDKENLVFLFDGDISVGCRPINLDGKDFYWPVLSFIDIGKKFKIGEGQPQLMDKYPDAIFIFHKSESIGVVIEQLTYLKNYMEKHERECELQEGPHD
jgi:hypothetical protein